MCFPFFITDSFNVQQRGPYFDSNQNSNITVLEKESVVLKCVVRNKGNKTVSQNYFCLLFLFSHIWNKGAVHKLLDASRRGDEADRDCLLRACWANSHSRSHWWSLAIDKEEESGTNARHASHKRPSKEKVRGFPRFLLFLFHLAAFADKKSWREQ